MKMKKAKGTLSLQWFTTFISTTLVLVLLGMVFLSVFLARRLSDSVKEDLTVTVLLSEEATESELTTLKARLSTERFVSRIDYISKEQALKEQIKAMGSDPSDFLGANPFTASFEIHMKAAYSNSDSLNWISAYLKEQPMTDDVIYQKELVDAINNNLHHLSYVFLFLAGLLTLVSVALINNTVRLSLYASRFVIRTMKLVGATRGFIRRPFMSRSFYMGLTAALVANGLLFGGIQMITRYDPSTTVYFDDMMLLCIGILVIVISLTLTLVCTYISTNKYLRKKASEVY
ncbi:MAG TPA: permease-like cell division protein FtsX [Candidatus Paraprevotella stercorigallinarum]|nr:permease-like cell division protein FtsX [Candidatus Paraprevotella stercorigallinarum]